MMVVMIIYDVDGVMVGGGIDTQVHCYSAHHTGSVVATIESIASVTTTIYTIIYKYSGGYGLFLTDYFSRGSNTSSTRLRGDQTPTPTYTTRRRSNTHFYSSRKGSNTQSYTHFKGKT